LNSHSFPKKRRRTLRHSRLGKKSETRNSGLILTEKILVEELINDHGMEGYAFRVDIDGTGPYVLKIVLVLLSSLSGM
jgi:hypothetical protein